VTISAGFRSPSSRATVWAGGIRALHAAPTADPQATPELVFVSQFLVVPEVGFDGFLSPMPQGSAFVIRRLKRFAESCNSCGIA
jgi:hypothetical protein